MNDPFDRFNDDPTRILRAFRISTQLNLTIEENTLSAIKTHANLLNNLIPKSSVRLYNELFKIMKHENCLNNLEIMYNFNILKIMGINTNIKILKLIEQSDIFIIKIMILLKNTSIDNFKKWNNMYQISAVDCVNKNDVILLELSNNQGLINMLNNLKHKWEMLRALNMLYFYSKDPLMLVYYLIEYVCIIDILDKKFLSELLNECKIGSYPFSVANIKITGDEIKNITGKSGKDIGILKDKLLSDIHHDLVNNNNEELKTHILKEKFL